MRLEVRGGRPETLGDAGGHEASGSPAEKVSWTCSWITSRATKSCFSLKRPLYSRRPSRSLVANLYRGLGKEWGAHLCAGTPPIQAAPKLALRPRLWSQNADDEPKQEPWHAGSPSSRAGEGCQAAPEAWRSPQVLCQQLLLVLSLPHLLPHPLPGGAPHAHSALPPPGPCSLTRGPG